MRSPNCCARAHTIAVVGLSADRTRPSHGVARALQRFGYRIIPVTPSAESILGEPAVASLEQLPEVLGRGERVDIVDVFRRPEHVAGIVSGLHSPAGSRRCGCRKACVDQAAAAARGAGRDFHGHGPLHVQGPRGTALGGCRRAPPRRVLLRYPLS